MYKCPCPEGYDKAETRCTLDYSQQPMITKKEQFGQCQDINECMDGKIPTNICPGNRICKNMIGGYLCHPENIALTCDNFTNTNNVVVPSASYVFFECGLSWVQSE